jgi:hypothetical protein
MMQREQRREANGAPSATFLDEAIRNPSSLSPRTQRQSIAHSLGRLAANGLVHRSGVGLGAVWTLVPNAAPPPGGGRSGGATELARARQRRS